MPGANATAPSAGATATATPAQNDADVGDDTLYRGSTKDSLGKMLRDDGALHFKPRAKEKIQQVDTLKNLQSSGTDPKFQTNLSNSGVASIENVGNKGKQDSDASDDADDQANEARDAGDNVDPRFQKKRLTFVREKNDDQKKAGSADSTPSPSPSPTASAAAKDSSTSKK